MNAGQMVMAELVPGSYWVRITNHSIIEAGTRYLVVGKAEWDGWFMCWKNGIKPPNRIFAKTGTLLKPEHFERETEEVIPDE